ncbi:MAG TPA: anthrone oxygenase family protein [Mycobacteriales bacterium]|nr:anthrone oxygenase family protein [Mycobacteriales bacterium]
MTTTMMRAPEGTTAMGFWASGALLAATVTAGLMAGLFAAFSYAIMPGLAKASDLAFVDGMQRINVAILNGWFGICFGGALLFSVLAAVLHLGADRRSVLPWVLAGAGLYLLVLVVTFAVNVPLNDKLNAAGLSDPHAAREAFEAVWVRWNIVRTVLCTAAFGCLAWALVLHGKLAG